MHNCAMCIECFDFCQFGFFFSPNFVANITFHRFIIYCDDPCRVVHWISTVFFTPHFLSRNSDQLFFCSCRLFPWNRAVFQLAGSGCGGGRGGGQKEEDGGGRFLFHFLLYRRRRHSREWLWREGAGRLTVQTLTAAPPHTCPVKICRRRRWSIVVTKRTRYAPLYCLLFFYRWKAKLYRKEKRVNLESWHFSVLSFCSVQCTVIWRKKKMDT